MSDSAFVVTVTAPFKKAVFIWNDACDSCEVDAYGFEDDELQMLVDTKAYMGADLAGFEVVIQ